MCFFEANYIMARDSNFQHCHVNTLRGKLGVALSEEHQDLKNNHDIVTFIPNCPAFAADRFASKLDLELIELFIKPKKTRSFQGSSEKDRAQAIKNNLIIPPHLIPKIKDKNIIVIDDSFVRGNNSKRAVYMLREAGVANITLVSYTPIIGQYTDGVQHGCNYGVDMPPTDNFLAKKNAITNRTNKEMAETIGANDIRFLSYEKMLEVFEQIGLPKDMLCTHCIGGEKPF
jgi:amidophosphoribosyltransferase